MKSPKEILKAITCDAIDKVYKDNFQEIKFTHLEKGKKTYSKDDEYAIIRVIGEKFIIKDEINYALKFLIDLLSYIRIYGVICSDENICEIVVPHKYLESDAPEPVKKSESEEERLRKTSAYALLKDYYKADPSITCNEIKREPVLTAEAQTNKLEQRIEKLERNIATIEYWINRQENFKSAFLSDCYEEIDRFKKAMVSISTK